MSTGETRGSAAPQIESISAVTLATHDMARAVQFYSPLSFPFDTAGPRLRLRVSTRAIAISTSLLRPRISAGRGGDD
jgi:hypothetical protein